jgi:glycosyltransferase involved in cell wall biosynthesis
MSAFDVLVVPSVNEGMGRVILEAAAAGTASVASDIGGIPEMIDDARTGVLVPPKDADAISGVLLELARAPQRLRAIGDAARARAVPRYSVEEMVARIEALYESLIEEKGLDG